jgi:hypothetical protein
MVHQDIGYHAGKSAQWYVSRSSITAKRLLTNLIDSEEKIIHWVRSIIDEAYAVTDFTDLSAGAAEFHDPAHLGLGVLQIWAHFFSSNTQWPFINIIGMSLEKYRIMLANQGQSSMR